MPDLQAFAENLWIVDGPPVRDMGVMFHDPHEPCETLRRFTMGEFSRVCTVRYAQTHHPIGPVRYLLAATRDMSGDWRRGHTLFPEAQLWHHAPLRSP